MYAIRSYYEGYMLFCLSPGQFSRIIPCRRNYLDIWTMLKELNIDCFQGYGNSCRKNYDKANNALVRMQATLRLRRTTLTLGSDKWEQKPRKPCRNANPDPRSRARFVAWSPLWLRLHLSRITSYNVCYTKLLRPLLSTVYKYKSGPSDAQLWI